MAKHVITAEEAVAMIANGAKAMGWTLVMADNDDDDAPLRYLIVGEDDIVRTIVDKIEE